MHLSICRPIFTYLSIYINLDTLPEVELGATADKILVDALADSNGDEWPSDIESDEELHDVEQVTDRRFMWRAS